VSKFVYERSDVVPRIGGQSYAEAVNDISFTGGKYDATTGRRGSDDGVLREGAWLSSRRALEKVEVGEPETATKPASVNMSLRSILWGNGSDWPEVGTPALGGILVGKEGSCKWPAVKGGVQGVHQGTLSTEQGCHFGEGN